MPATRNFKLGLFVLVALAAGTIATVTLGIRAMAPRAEAYHTYFDESVQGLELGAPVKYRGVRIGSVEEISIAPDRKHVAVQLALVERDAERLGLGADGSAVRAQLVVQGLTGLKFVDIDVVDPVRTPPPALRFVPEMPYIPSRPSMITGLSAEMESLAHRLPEVTDRAMVSLDKLDRVLEDIHDQRLAARAGDTFDQLTSATADVRRMIAHVDGAQLPDRVAQTLARADAAIAQVDSVLRRIDGDHGLVASAHRATDAAGDLGRSTLTSTDDLGRTMRELSEAARAIRELADELAREPDMLVKGRARSTRR